MAALLAGARLVLRQGLRFLPAYGVQPAAVPVRCLSRSARFLTTAVQDIDATDESSIHSNTKTVLHDGLPIYKFGKILKHTGWIRKTLFLKTFQGVFSTGKPSINQAWLLLQTCGSSMPAVPPAERTQVADDIWDKLQKMGFVFDVNSYNLLLRIYLENGHQFSPTEFLAKMEAAKLQPNSTTYEGLIAAYCSNGDIEGASKILNFMKSNNLPITEGVFSSLITGHARSGDMESAESILPVMQGVGIKPGIDTYSALLCAYAEKGDIESVKQTLEDCKNFLTDVVLMKVIHSLAQSSHSKFVPDILTYIKPSAECKQKVTSLCLSLLTQGYGDTGLEVAKKLLVPFQNVENFMKQPCSFFLRHCVALNMPVDDIKNYAMEFQACNLHKSPMEFSLHCALSTGKKDMAMELLRTMKEEDISIRQHYFWPLLASFHNERNLQGVLQVLDKMHDMDVELNLHMFVTYVAPFYAIAESFESVLQESGFQESYNNTLRLILRGGLLNNGLKQVYDLLKTTKYPIVNDTTLKPILFAVFSRCRDVEFMAKITMLWYHHESNPSTAPKEPETVGYFLYGLIKNMGVSEVQAKERYLKQYFHQLKEMGAKVESKKGMKILSMLDNFSVPLLAEEFRNLVHDISVIDAATISELEELLERKQAENQSSGFVLACLINKLIELQDVEKVVDLTLKHSDCLEFEIHNKVLDFCCKMDNLVSARKLKVAIDKREFVSMSQAEKYMEVLKVLAVNGYVEDAINILKEMQASDEAIGIDFGRKFSAILKSMAVKGNVEGVNLLHENIVMMGLASPTFTLCSPLVVVHLELNDLSSAVDAFITCYKKYNCFSMDYSLVLKFVEKDELAPLLEAVSETGEKMMENLLLQNILLAFIECGKYAEAKKIAQTPGFKFFDGKLKWALERFKSKNLVEVLEKCLEIIMFVQKSDREMMYLNLLLLYEKNNDWVKATQLFHQMKAEGIKVQGKFSNLFIHIFRKNDQDVFEHLLDFGSRDEAPRSTTQVNREILRLCEEGNHVEAFNLFMEVEQKVSLPKITFVRLIKTLMEADFLGSAQKVEECAKRHFSDFSLKNISNNLLVQQVKRDCLKDALVTLKKILENGHKPSQATLIKLIQGFSLKGDLRGLEEVEMLITNASLLKPEGLVQSKMFAHFKNGNIEEATAILEAIFIKEPNISVLPFLKELDKNDMHQELEQVSIVAERLANHFLVYKLVTQLFLLYVESEKVETAKRLLERCGAILEQTEALQRYMLIKIQKEEQHHVYRLLEVLADPYYKESGYNALLKHYVVNQKLEAAVELYKRMKAEQINLYEKQLFVSLLKDANMPDPFEEPQDSDFH